MGFELGWWDREMLQVLFVIKGKLYYTIIWSLMLYGVKCGAIKCQQEHKLSVQRQECCGGWVNVLEKIILLY